MASGYHLAIANPERLLRLISASKFLRPGGPYQHPRKMPLHHRPLAHDDAVNACIANGPIWQDLIVSQYSVQLCSQPLDGSSARVIEEVSAQLHADAIQRFKCMSEQKQLALCVERGALHAFAIPCAADLHTAVGLVHIPVACHPHNFFRGSISHRKRKHAASLPGDPAAVNFSFHLRGFGDDCVPELPQLSILHGFNQIAMVDL